MRATVLNWIKPRGLGDWLAVVVTVAVTTLMGYWAIVDRQPIGESISVVLTPSVRPGEAFTIHYKVRWNSACSVTGYRFVIDSDRQQYTIAPDQRYVRPSQDEFHINVPIPATARPGPAIYRATVMYECNPLQRLFPLERALPDRTFIILPNEESQLMRALSCPDEKPVAVAAHCRRRPGASAELTRTPLQ